MEDKRLKNLAAGREKLAKMRADGVPVKRKPKKAPIALKNPETGEVAEEQMRSIDSAGRAVAPPKKVPRARAAKSPEVSFAEQKALIKVEYKKAVAELRSYYE